MSSSLLTEFLEEEAHRKEDQRETRLKELANIMLQQLRDTRLKELSKRFHPRVARWMWDIEQSNLAHGLRAWRLKVKKDYEMKLIIESSENGYSYHVDIGEDNSIGDHKVHGRRNTCESSQQVFVSTLVALWIFFKRYVHDNIEEYVNYKELIEKLTMSDDEQFSISVDEDKRFPMDYDIDLIGESTQRSWRSLTERKVPRQQIERKFGQLEVALPSEARITRAHSQDDETAPIVGSAEAENSYPMDIGEDNRIGERRLLGRRNIGWSSRKADVEKIFVITNFVLELPSTVFDQLSSVHKPQYALLSMLISVAATLMCIAELVYKIRNDKVTWKWRTTLPWLYYPSQNHKPFGNFKDIIGSVCALCQCIVATITFVFVRQHADNPIKVSVWPIIFAFGLLCSKFLEKPERRNA